MAISKVGGSASDNWELISSVTPTATTATVNFTGLTPYRKLMVVANGVTLVGVDGLGLRINNDSGNNYSYSYWSDAPDIRQQSFTSQITWTFTGITQTGVIVLSSCDNTGVKFVETAWGGLTSSNTATQFIERGIYLASAIVTQINILTGSTFAGAGTIALYGVK